MPAENPLFTRKTALMRRVEARTGQSLEVTLLSLFNSNVLPQVAASRLGVSVETYYAWVFKLRGVHLGISREEKTQGLERAEQLYAEGFPLYHISKETRMSIRTIKKHVGK